MKSLKKLFGKGKKRDNDKKIDNQERRKLGINKIIKGYQLKQKRGYVDHPVYGRLRY